MAFNSQDLGVDSVPFTDMEVQGLGPGFEQQHQVIEGGMDKPVITITEQPKARDSRFRYKSEGETAGSLHGENSKPERPTYPSVQIENCQGEGKMVVSLASKEDPPCPHPYSLVGKDCSDGLCIIPVGPGMQTISCAGMGIRCEKKRDVTEAFEMKKRNYFQPFTGETSRRPEDLDINACRLCFQLFVQHPNYPNTYIVSDPTLSVPIYDKKAAGTGNLQIVRLDKTSGKVTGGEEIYMLVEKVKKEDIEVQFIEGQWKSRGDFGQSDVHKQYAIVFKTPPYYKQDIQRDVIVQIRLFRPSNGEYSDPVKFIYTPAISDSEGIQKKRQKVVDFTKFVTGKQPVIHQEPLLPNPDALQSIPSFKGRVRPGMFQYPDIPHSTPNVPHSMPTYERRIESHCLATGTQRKRPLDTDIPRADIFCSGVVSSMSGQPIDQYPQLHQQFQQRQGFGSPSSRIHGREIQGSNPFKIPPQQIHQPQVIKKPPNDFPFSSVVNYSGPGMSKNVCQAMEEILERPVQMQQRSPRQAAEASAVPTSGQHQMIGFTQTESSGLNRPQKLSPFIEQSATDSCFYDMSQSEASNQSSDSTVDSLTSEVIEEWNKYMKDGNLPTGISQQFVDPTDRQPKIPALKVEINPAKTSLHGFLGSDLVCDSSPITDIDDPFQHISDATMKSVAEPVSFFDGDFELQGGTFPGPEVIGGTFAGPGVVVGAVDEPGVFEGAVGGHTDLAAQHFSVQAPVNQVLPSDVIVNGEQINQSGEQEPKPAIYPTATHKFDHLGGKMEITEYGVCLIVPPNAIPEGHSQEISISISWNKTDKPNLLDGEAMVSPIVCCEPNGLQFKRPVALSFQHCLNFSEKDTHKISLQSTQSQIGEVNHWIKKGVLESGGSTCIVSKDRCVVFTDHFTKYGLSAEMGEDMTKRVKVAVYATPLHGTQCDETLRVYAINATADAEQEMKADEKEMGGVLAASHSYHLKENVSSDLDVKITKLDDGWKLISGSEMETLSKKEIMSGYNTSCSFTFANQCSQMNFRCKLVIGQEGSDSKPVSPFISRHVQMQDGNRNQPYCHPNLEAVPRPTASSFHEFSLISQIARPAVQIDIKKVDMSFEFKNELRLRLDPLHPFGYDWRMLASKMGYSKYIRNLEHVGSPTEQLLIVAECCYSAEDCLPKLMKMLKEIDRSDAAGIVERFLLQMRADEEPPSFIQSDNDEDEAGEVEDYPDLVNVTKNKPSMPDLQYNLNLQGSPNPGLSPNQDTAHYPGEEDQAQIIECQNAIRALNEACNPQHLHSVHRSKSDEENQNLYLAEGTVATEN